MRAQILFPTIAIAVMMASCSSSRTTSGLSGSKGQKPRLGERIDRMMTDAGHEPAPLGFDADRGSVPEVAGVGNVPISTSLIDPPAPVLNIDVPTSLTASTAATGSAVPIARRAQATVRRGVVSLFAVPLLPTAPEGSGGTNVWAIVGFVCAFLLPLLGIIFSAIALSQIKRTGERGHDLALAGLIIGIVFLVVATSLIA